MRRSDDDHQLQRHSVRDDQHPVFLIRPAARASCDISVTNGVFGDPCGGTYKYLTVDYMCIPPPTFQVSNVVTASTQCGGVYGTTPLQVGTTMYCDRDYTFTSVPPFLAGSTLIQTANNDKRSDPTDLDFVCFVVDAPATVYLLYDSRATDGQEPAWMLDMMRAQHQQVAEVTDAGMGTMEVWVYYVEAAGNVCMGGNNAPGVGSNYLIAIGGPVVHEMVVGASPNAYEYIGCYEDNSSRDLEVNGGNLDAPVDQRPMQCANFCSGYYYMAMQWHSECWCDNDYGMYSERAITECDSDGSVGAFPDYADRTGTNANDPVDQGGLGIHPAGWTNSVYDITYFVPTQIDIANAGFEADAISGFVYMQPTGWSNGGGTVVVTSGNGPWGGAAAAEGAYFMSIQGTGAYLEQTVQGLEVGQTYTLTFSSMHRPGYGTDEVLLVSVSGQAQFYEHPGDDFTVYNEVFTASGTTATIRFQNGSPTGGDNSVFLDAVSLMSGGTMPAQPDYCTSASSCADLGWSAGRNGDLVCAESDMSHNGMNIIAQACQGANDGAIDGWAHAAAICLGVGARLCSIDEITAEETRGTGCGHDNDQTWSSTPCARGAGYMSARGLGLAVRCCADRDTSADTACVCTSAVTCNNLGWGAGRGSDQVCAQSNMNHNGVETLNSNTCLGADNDATDGFVHAAAVCSGAGARLCTVAELTNQETRGTGCGHDNDQVWSSTPCDGGSMSAQGQQGQNPTCQTDLTQSLAVRCCADAVLPLGSVPCWFPAYEAPPPPPLCTQPCFPNGDFEQDTITGFVYMQPKSWTHGGAGTVVVQTGNGPWGG